MSTPTPADQPTPQEWHIIEYLDWDADDEYAIRHFHDRDTAMRWIESNDCAMVICRQGEDGTWEAYPRCHFVKTPDPARPVGLANPNYHNGYECIDGQHCVGELRHELLIDGADRMLPDDAPLAFELWIGDGEPKPLRICGGAVSEGAAIIELEHVATPVGVTRVGAERARWVAAIEAEIDALDKASSELLKGGTYNEGKAVAFDGVAQDLRNILAALGLPVEDGE